MKGPWELRVTTASGTLALQIPEPFAAERATFELWDLFTSLDARATVSLRCEQTGTACEYSTDTGTTPRGMAFDFDMLERVTH